MTDLTDRIDRITLEASRHLEADHDRHVRLALVRAIVGTLELEGENRAAEIVERKFGDRG